ncbi:MAG: PAS domain S-box-containing protein [Natronomonas sp.]|jgi:PAS domain S-box-containing protein
MRSEMEPIDVLLVDDEPAVAEVTVEFLERQAAPLNVAIEVDPTNVLERLENETFDCIVSDYDMPEMNGLELLETVREVCPDLPFILYTGKGSEDVASRAISAGVTDYVRKQRDPSQYELLTQRVRTAVNGHRAQSKLADLNRINRTLRETIQAVLRAETRTGVKQAVCDSLADSDPYLFAWFGTLSDDREIVPETWAGVEQGYLETIRITADRTPTGRGPSGKAVRTGDPQAVQNIHENPDFEPWREAAERRGYRSTAAIPISYEGDRYGVLNVYADRPYAFDERELAVLAELGSTIAHAIHRIALTERLEHQYRSLFEEAPVMAVTTRNEDGEPVIEACNRLFLQTIGKDRSEVVGRPLTAFYTPEAERKLLDEGGYTRALSNEFTNEERTLVTADGEPVETLLRAVPRAHEDGEPIGTFALYVDISERKQLRRENERLEQFASIVSHDLRNPLTVIKGRAELARETCDDEGQADIDAIVTATERMEALIEDLLMLARQGQTLDEVEPVALPTLVENCWRNVDSPGATLNVETDRTIWADASRLQQLLENLLRNAVEHGSPSPPSQAQADAVEHGSTGAPSRTGEDGGETGGDGVTITIGDLEDGFFLADDGEGIPESKRARVFDPGYSTASAGTGFGLAIVQEIAEAHGWDIDVTESSEGGARFEIRNTTTVRMDG